MVAQAIVLHFDAVERARGIRYDESFRDPFTGRQVENCLTVPVRLLRALQLECTEPTAEGDLTRRIAQQKTVFESWALTQGLSLDLTATEGARFKQTLGGLHLATYLHDATEGAWRAWAHVAAQATNRCVPGEHSNAGPRAADPQPAYSEEGWCSGYGLPSASQNSNDPNAGWTSGA